MGDRCSLEISVKHDDRKLFERIMTQTIGGDKFWEMVDEEHGYATYYLEEVNYGLYTELENIADHNPGLILCGHQGQGYEYPSSDFCMLGGRVYYYEYMKAEFDYNLNLDYDALAQHALWCEVYREAEAHVTI